MKSKKGFFVEDCRINRLKEAFGLEGLSFYQKRGKYHCKYQKGYDDIDYTDLHFLMTSLSIQQGHVFFDDVDKTCVGIDELKREYLIFKLSGL
jgi:hypothetical protein